MCLYTDQRPCLSLEELPNVHAGIEACNSIARVPSAKKAK